MVYFFLLFFEKFMFLIRCLFLIEGIIPTLLLCFRIIFLLKPWKISKCPYGIFLLVENGSGHLLFITTQRRGLCRDSHHLETLKHGFRGGTEVFCIAL